MDHSAIPSLQKMLGNGVHMQAGLEIITMKAMRKQNALKELYSPDNPNLHRKPLV
jgi:hypothetical protein